MYLPKSFEKFQEIKYNNDVEWEELKLEYADTKLRNKIKEKYNLKIHKGRQGKHIKGHHNYKGASYLLEDIEPQELVDKYAGTGELKRDNEDKWTNKEFIICDRNIGFDVGLDGTKIKTNYFSISYSKEDGTHIVPRKIE